MSSLLNLPPLARPSSSASNDDGTGSSSSSTPSFIQHRNLEDYVLDVLQRLQTQDPSYTKLQIDDFHYPNGDFLNENSYNDYFDTITICKLLQNCQLSPHVNELEFRFVDFNKPVIKEFVQLLTSKDDRHGRCQRRFWKSISIIGCGQQQQQKLWLCTNIS